MPYNKPFREPAELIEELRGLGMGVPDEEVALQFLRRVGYYRSGGYRYVFREKLPAAERDARTRTFRKPTYVVGSSLTDVERIERFDAKLREVCQAGLADFELRARAAIAHALARHDVFGHTNTNHLDLDEARKTTGRDSKTKFEVWEETYLEAIRASSSEDFVAHLLVKYGHPLPIWATVDVLSFGSLPYLYDLMRRDDRLEVSRSFGVAQDNKFGAWLRSMVDFRNYCAHGARLFNRHFKRDVRVVSGAIDTALLGHVTNREFSVSDTPSSRTYVNAALLAYMLRKHSSGSSWHLTFKTQMRKFPEIEVGDRRLISPESDMGFPDDWERLGLWN